MKKPTLLEDLFPLSRASYEDVLERYVTLGRGIPGVRAIYQFGAVGAPGLSDLDVIVVLDDDADGDARLQELSVGHPRWRDDRALARCFIHDVLVCSAGQFERLNWALVTEPPRLLAGEPLPLATPAADQAPLLTLIQVLDFALARIHELERPRERPEVSTRWLVPQLWSIVHTKRVLERAELALGAEWGDVEARLRTLRATPVAEISPDDVRVLWREVHALYALAVGLLTARLVSAGALPAARGSASFALADARQHTLNVYAPGNGVADVRVEIAERAFRFGRREVRSTWTQAELPLPLLAHTVGYLAASRDYDHIAGVIAARAGERQVSSDAHLAIVGRRQRLAEDNASFLARQGLGFGRVSVPGAPAPTPHPAAPRGSWRFELIRRTLERRLLTAGTIHLAPRTE